MSRIRGWKGARGRARARPGVLDEMVLDGLAATVTEVRQDAWENINSMATRRTGILRRNYRKSMSKAKMTGRVGYITRAAKRKAFYARFIHDGTRYIQARPFHDIAVARQEGKHRARMARAQHRAVKK